jgi:two-component system response regulator HydG
MQARVLIVDDDRDMREALEVSVAADGYDCAVVENAADALAIVERQTFDVIICDVLMDGMSGLDLLDRLKQSHPAVPFIVITGVGGVRQAVDAVRRGAFDYVEKPFDAAMLRHVIAQALDGRRHPIESTRHAANTPSLAAIEIVGVGPSMRAVQTAIDFIARSSAPVLVTGETGSGKEIVARAIHSRSARRDRPFVAVNMSAIPRELMEGEIFGHVRGAFTGAAQARKGLFVEADGGTFLLDEIGDLPLELQAKLLRVLQFGEIRPVGSERVQHVDVRVIAATHRDVDALVKEGRFREDLYFRLDVLRLHVPPLREHREDIPTLAAHFLAQACQRAPLSPVRSIGKDALDALDTMPWRGNVRELASVIERAVVFGVDEMIDVNQIAPRGKTARSPDAKSWPMPPWTLRQMNRSYTDWVLEQTSGDKERAADILGIDLSTLYRWQRARDD